MYIWLSDDLVTGQDECSLKAKHILYAVIMAFGLDLAYVGVSNNLLRPVMSIEQVKKNLETLCSMKPENFKPRDTEKPDGVSLVKKLLEYYRGIDPDLLSDMPHEWIERLRKHTQVDIGNLRALLDGRDTGNAHTLITQVLESSKST